MRVDWRDEQSRALLSKGEEKHLEEIGIEGVTITKIEVFACRGCCAGLVATLLLPANFAQHPARANNPTAPQRKLKNLA
jgi:hypothetical protein